MAGENVVEVKFGANVEGLRAGAREATGHVDSLRESLLGIKAEATQTGRAARFFANDLAALIPASDGAKGAIRDLFEVVLAGSAFGAVAAAVKLVVGAFDELHKEGTKKTAELSKATDEWLAHVKAVHEETEKLRLSLRGISTTELQAYAELQPLREQRLKQQAALSKAEGDLGEAEVRASKATGSALTSTLTIKASLTAAAHKEIADAREALRITNEKIAALEKEYAVRARIASTGPLEKSIEEAKERAAQATEDSAINLARIQTEQEARDAREMGKVRLNADEKMELAREIAEAQLRADQATEQSAINLARIETEQRGLTKKQLKEVKTELHEFGAMSQSVGGAIGDMFAGMADSSKTAAGEIVQMLKTIIKAVLEMAIKMVMAKAATTAAEGAEAVAGTPGIGPFLAIGAIAMLEGAVLGLLSLIPTAAGGYDIPSGVNPIVQAHGGEMILPRDIADPLRAQLGGGASGGVTVNLHITTMDAQSFHGYLTSGEGARGLERAFRDLRRRGVMP